jgi:hypothetical protein
MFNDWRLMFLDEQPHPGYALKLAHINVVHNGDRRRLRKNVRLAGEFIGQKPVFTPRQTWPVPQLRKGLPVIGQAEYEWKQFGLGIPKAQPYTSLANSQA